MLSLSVGFLSLLFTPFLTSREVRAQEVAVTEEIAAALDQEPLRWAEIIFLRNRAQLLRDNQDARRANVSDRLSVGDALRTLRRSRAELRFNDDSLARIGERATFQFTPNTRNFQLTNGTVLLLIPPSRGRTTIQTPNAVTGIQGSALFVRYIPETDTTIVGALTDNPNGPMVLFNEDGTEQQALRANEVGVIEGDRITELYRLDSELFWESSPLAEGFDYTQDSPTGADALDAVRREIREAISKQDPLPDNDDSIIENPDSFRRPVDEAAEDIDETPGDNPAAEPTEDSTDEQTESENSSQTPVQDSGGNQSSSGDQSNRDNVDGQAQQTTSSDTSNSNSNASAAGSTQTPRSAALTDTSSPDTSSSNTSSPNTSTPNTSSALDTSNSSNEDATPTSVTDSVSVSSPSVTQPVAGSSTDSQTGSGSSVENTLILNEGTASEGAQVVTPTVTTPTVEPENQAPLEPVEPISTAEETEEPVVELQFEGTPAEEYLSVPQSQVQTEIPDVGENNGLVPAANIVKPETTANTPDEETTVGVDPEATTPTDENVIGSEEGEVGAEATADPAVAQEEISTDIDEQTAGVDLDNSSTVDAAIDDIIPAAGLQDSPAGEGIEGEGIEGEGIEGEGIEGEGTDTQTSTEGAVDPAEPTPTEPIIPVEAETPTAAEPPVEVEGATDAELPPVEEPSVEEPSVEEPPVEEPQTEIEIPIEPQAPANNEIPVNEPTSEVEAPVLPETPEAPTDLVIPTEEQLLLPEDVNPEVAQPIDPVDAPTELIQSPEPEFSEPEIPEPEVPEPEIPEPEIPEPEVPEPEIPEPEIPEPEIPEPEIPEPEIPEPEVPEPEIPEPEISEPELLEPELPETEVLDSDVPEPEVPEAELIDPEIPEPEVPEPVLPEPEIPEAAETPDTAIPVEDVVEPVEEPTPEIQSPPENPVDERVLL